MEDTFTIPQLLKLLPMEDTLRNELSAEYETYSEGRKFEIKQILWEVFFEMTDLLTDLKYDQLLVDITEGKRNELENLYEEAKSLVYQDYKDVLAGKKEEIEQIDKIRDQLKGLIGDATA